jgi:hypothetical protein
MGMGDDKLVTIIKFICYSILFYIIGYKVGIYNLKKYRTIFISYIFLYYAISVLYGFITAGLGNLADIDRSTLTRTISTEEDERSVILLWPFIFQIMNLGFINMFVNTKNLIIKVTLITILIGLTLAIFFSTFSAVVMMVFISTIMYFGIIFYHIFFKKSGIKTNKLIVLIFSIIILIGSYLSIKYIFSGAYGDMGGSSAEISKILDINTDVTENNLDDITNNRWTELIISLNGFLSSPIIGNGAFYFSRSLGGHSFIFDTLSSFGLVGSIPIFLIYIVILYKYFRFLNKYPSFEKEWIIGLSFFISTLVIFLSSALNPYLMHSSIDFVIFFYGGYLSGFNDYSINKINFHNQKFINNNK